jgi:hypothetical protein
MTIKDGETEGLKDLARRLREENERLKALLAYAVKEADGWHDECRGGTIDEPLMIEARKAARLVC